MINNWIGAGRLTTDPELKQTASGVSTCNFTIAIRRDFDSGGGERQTDFINAVAWRQTAEFICKYFRKGNMIVIEGELQTRTYNDKRYPDVKHHVTVVNSTHAKFYDYYSPATDGGGNNYPAPAQTAPQAPAQVPNLDDFEQIGNDGDLPF